MDYAVIFVIVVAVLVVEVGGHELTRIAIPRRAGAVVGAVVAYLLACAPMFVVYACRGGDGDRFYGVADVLDGGAATGKLAPGDRILAVDGTPVRHGPSLPSLAARVEAGQGAPLTLTIRRDDARRDVVVQPQRDGSRWLLGIRTEIQVDPEIGRAAVLALWSPIDRTDMLVRSVRDMIAGGEADPGGPTRIVEGFKLADEPAWARGLSGGALAAYYGLLVLLVLDALRLVRRPTAG